MHLEEFERTLAELGWKLADFCRMTGLHRNTPGRWRREGVPIPEWVPRYLALTLEVQRLHRRFVLPPAEAAGDLEPDQAPE